MSRSFRGRPEFPEEPDINEEPLGELQSDAPDDEWPRRPYTKSQASKYSVSEKLAKDAAQVDIGKRLVALTIDIAVGYLAGLAINCVPFINIYFSAQVIMVLYLLVRDGLFNGRGVGKNLMGLQVVDMRSGEPASMVQSLKRNIVVYGPVLILYIIQMLISIIPNEVVTTVVNNGVQAVLGIYSFIVIPYEAYRVYSRADGLRWGDKFAGTAIVLADMDFSGPRRS